MEKLEQLAVNVVRGLSMDAVQEANSGHPGTPMALAPLAHVLYTRVMKYDASDPQWPDRDRFILSAGHASMLLYSMLYLTGFGLTLDDIKQFRQWGSRTPGHPEHGHAEGIEVTTGPLGAGFANGVGMAIAEANLRARFGPEVCDHHTFVICSDGDLSEGVSHEAASLAGHLGLGRMVYVYDDNHITIDGPTEIALTDDAVARFRAYGWHVLELGEAAEDLDALERGLREAMAVEDRPSLVVLRSHIGYPSPNFTDTPEAHGSPLGAEEVARTKEILGLPAEKFYAPDEVVAFYREAGRRGAAEREAWKGRVGTLRADNPELAEEHELCLAGTGKPGWQAKLPSWAAGTGIATRVACGDVLNAIADVVPGLIGGGADLTGNTGTKLKGFGEFSKEDRKGRQVYFGVREHGMGSALNGMALHGGALPFGGTFLVFSDYMRGSVRLAALEQARSLFVWTHDSVGLGEDGPTHQPIEHVASLRAMPGLRVIRPADANETAQAWRAHIEGTGPTALILSRQKLPVLEGTSEKAEAGVAKGAYVLVEEQGQAPDVVLIGTGSEVSVCVEAARQLAAAGTAARVVSMPCWELFELLPDDERAAVLPSGVPTLSVEAGTTFGWHRFADDAVGIDRFGASAPGEVALANLGLTPENVVARAQALLQRGAGERNEQP